MGEWAPAVGVIGLALVIGATLVVTGPVGKALLAELDELKRRVAEAEERLDFTERLLAKERDGQRPAPPPRPGRERTRPSTPFLGGGPASRTPFRPSCPAWGTGVA